MSTLRILLLALLGTLHLTATSHADNLNGTLGGHKDWLYGIQKSKLYAVHPLEGTYTELADVPFLRFWDMVRVAPDLARLRADRTVYDTVKRFVKHDHLRQADAGGHHDAFRARASVRCRDCRNAHRRCWPCQSC